MTDRGWSPNSMPRRETQHAYLHPQYDGRWRGQTTDTRPAARVVEERQIMEEVTLLVEVDEPSA